MLDLSTDYQIFDEGDATTQLEDAVYYSVNTAGETNDATTFALSNIIKLDLIAREGRPSDGVYVKYDTYVDCPIQDFVTNSIMPKVGDVILDTHGKPIGTMQYYVLEVRQPVFGDYWGMKLISLELQPTLATHITITRPNDVIDSFLSPITNAGVQENLITAVIVQTGNELVEFHGKKGFRQHYNVYTYLDEDYPLGSVIQDVDGTKYIVEGTEFKQRMQDLMVIRTYRNP